MPTQASELVAKDGDIEAAYQRGMAHVFGSTADHDYASAAEDLRQAATAGRAEAELALGYLYEKGSASANITGSQ
jgi:TPR repeat protein